MNFISEPLDKRLHDRASFDCGVGALNDFLKSYASQNQSKNIARTYVAVSPEVIKSPKTICGYYTLSSGQINFDQLPESKKSKLQKYPVPVARIGRLARDIHFRGQGVGEFLLRDALINVLDISERIATFAVVVDAKDGRARAFYEKYGFSVLQDSALTLFLTVDTIKSAVL